MSEHTVSSPGAATEHLVAVPGGTIYYRTEGSGPLLVLIGGGPSNADTLNTLAGQLAASRTIITYDRRGYSRSQLDDPSQPASINLHADDVCRVIDDLGAGPASVFATSVGEGREFYPHRCAQALAAELTTPLIELPGQPRRDDHPSHGVRLAPRASRLAPLLP